MAQQIPVTVRVVDGDWGGASLADIKAVADSAIGAFLQVLANYPPTNIALQPTATENDVPMALAEKNENGEFVVLVNARGNLWARLAYQFAHEFCHVLGDSTTWAEDRFAWVEEVLCEAASLFALHSMASAWSTNPPYPNWRAYSSCLNDYAEGEVSSFTTLQAELIPWLAERLPYLEADPRIRRDNGAIAVRLLPLFEASPAAWRVMRHLHGFERSKDLGLAGFIQAWCSSCPEDDRILVRQFAALLGVEAGA
jgi:hypothetical protein